MKNLTLAIDEDLLMTARKLALDRNTSVNQLIREYLQSLVEEDRKRRDALDRLKSCMARGILEAGDKHWTRDELHER